MHAELAEPARLDKLCIFADLFMVLKIANLNDICSQSKLYKCNSNTAQYMREI